MFPLLLTVLVLLRFLISCIAYLFGGQGCGLGLETHQRLVSVSAIYVSCPRRYFRPNCGGHISKMSRISSRYLPMAVLTRIG